MASKFCCCHASRYDRATRSADAKSAGDVGLGCGVGMTSALPNEEDINEAYESS